MDDLNDRLEDKEHEIKALASQSKSVSALMKEIKRLEKIAGRKSYQETVIVQHEASKMRCAELETKLDLIMSENVLLNETIQKLVDKHGVLDELERLEEQRQADFEAKVARNNETFENDKKQAQKEVEEILKKGTKERETADRLHYEFIETSKAEHEKWLASSIQAYQEEFARRRKSLQGRRKRKWKKIKLKLQK